MKMLPLVMLLLLLLFMPTSSNGSRSVQRVVATDFEFTPARVTISRNSRVRWLFREGAHNVVGRGWGSRQLQTSGSYTHRFRRAGLYPYVCTIHPGMEGRVRVRR